MENFLILDEKKTQNLFFHQNNLTTYEYGNGIYTRYIVDDIDRIIRLSAICNKRGGLPGHQPSCFVPSRQISSDIFPH